MRFEKRWKKISVLCVLVLGLVGFSVEALAATWTWGTKTTINYVNPTGSGYAFKLDGAADDVNSACPGSYIITNGGDPEYQAKVATLMSAYFANYKIILFYDSASTACGTPVSQFAVYRT